MRSDEGVIPVFPLPGVLLLPGGHLPLNIFEDQYIAMVEDALKSTRIIGMIQPRERERQTHNEAPWQHRGCPLYKTGCAGRITSFSETEDGRYEIVLTGTSRFAVKRELERLNGYRRVEADWNPFVHDLACGEEQFELDRTRLHTLLKCFFSLHNLSCNWEMIEAAPDARLINILSMICPLDPCEKQGLLEAPDCARRAEMFLTMLELALHGPECGGTS